MITTAGNLTTLAYESAGTGTPVVLLHGLTSTGPRGGPSWTS